MIEPPVAGRSAALDALRGLSIAAVVAYHYHKAWFAYGNYGVLLFFLLSGYCVADSAATARGAWHFWSKRLARLLPALLVCGALTVAVKQWVEVPPDRQAGWSDYVTTLFVLPLLNPLRVEYRLPDGAYWSLIVEFQFYALVTFALLAGLRRRLVPSLMACQAAALAAAALALPLPALACHLPAFLAGAAIHALHRSERRTGGAGLALAALGFGLAPALGLSDPGLSAGDVGRVAFVIAVVLLLLAVPWLERGVRRSRSGRGLAALGLVSYPLYLLHQDLGNLLLARFGDDFVSPAALLARLLAVPALFGLLAWLVWRGVERPLRPVLARQLSALPGGVEHGLMAAGGRRLVACGLAPAAARATVALLLLAGAGLGVRLAAQNEVKRLRVAATTVLTLPAGGRLGDAVRFRLNDGPQQRVLDIPDVSWGACAALLGHLQRLDGVQRLAVGTRAADEHRVPMTRLAREWACLGPARRLVRLIAAHPGELAVGVRAP